MAGSSMAGSSSSYNPYLYNACLSFSPEDETSISFVSDLYRSLSDKGTKTYYKDDSLEKKLSSFDYATVAVVIVSENYKTSVLCLNELDTIIRLHDSRGLSIFLIYYGVDPWDFRKQIGEDYAETFRNLIEEYSAEKVQEWRSALTRLTNIFGLDSRFWSKDANMVDLISEEISLRVKKNMHFPPSTKSDGHLALDRHMEALYELLDLKSNKEVRFVGIWGPGGVGKTTLARYAYEEMFDKFHVHMFVDNFDKNYQQQHLETFTATEIQDEAQTMASNKIDDIKLAFKHRKGLLVIDYVDNLDRLKNIAESIDWFGSGSRVIFVTEDKNMLDELGVKHVYEVQGLRYDEALQLFSQCAFKQPYPPTSFESLSLRAVQISSFFPLSLKILGSSLRGKDEEVWEKMLQKLEGEQEKNIMEIMKKTYTRGNEE